MIPQDSFWISWETKDLYGEFQENPPGSLDIQTCYLKERVLHSQHEVVQLHDRRNVLLCRDLLRAYAFWREEMAELEHFTSCRLHGSHRQIQNWQVGFSFWGECSKRGVRRTDSR